MKIKNGLDHSQGIEQNKRKGNWLYQNCLKTAAMCDYSSNILWSVTMAMQVKSYNRHSRMFAHHEATYEVWGQQLQLMVAYYYYQLCTRNLPQLLRYAYCTQAASFPGSSQPFVAYCTLLFVYLNELWYPVVCAVCDKSWTGAWERGYASGMNENYWESSLSTQASRYAFEAVDLG